MREGSEFFYFRRYCFDFTLPFVKDKVVNVSMPSISMIKRAKPWRSAYSCAACSCAMRVYCAGAMRGHSAGAMRGHSAGAMRGHSAGAMRVDAMCLHLGSCCRA